ncbi:uncharacterized protein LOC108907418 [Anoplophora glabripennis]|uniref:uncharacterized protein LOC108907418 n=1 Tax=Anoplophora glabripennis TaxID=217634 RepID=UPI0008754D6D|nr:uncharacterized protein LOC108907418 [Anoplophora glabripennis]
MAPTKWYQVIVLLYLRGFTGAFGDDIVILPLRSYACEGSDPDYDYFIDVRNINDDGVKVLDVDVTLEDDLSEKWTFILNIDKWNNGDWEEHFYDTEGSICQIINQYVSRAWEKFRKGIVPEIPDVCHAPADTYKLTSFNVSQTDYDIPVGILGTYKVTGRILNEMGSELICQVIEVETRKT